MKWLIGLMASCTLIVSPALAQPPVMELGSEADKMAPFAGMHGAWRGTVTSYNPDGSTTVLTQTERVGPMLQGDLLLVEGKATDEAGNTAFNAFAVMSYDEEAKSHMIRAYLFGRSGDYPVTLTDTGWVWEIPAGPGGKVRYTVTIGDGKWHELGEYMVDGNVVAKTVEMKLERVGATDWPQAGAVPVN